MVKPFPSILWGAALLIFSRHSRLLAHAAITADQEYEAERILRDMEIRVKELRDEIESVYKERCESRTYDDCIGNNYDDCMSTFPNQQCIKPDEFVMSRCGDYGYGCNALWDKTISKVSLPEAVADSDKSDIIERVAETACYTRLAEPYMVKKYREDEEYWSKKGKGIQPSWAYFGSYDGLYRAVPAIHQLECGVYDPRRRPWFVAASSGRKDVVILIDVSRGMGNLNVTMKSVKEAAKTIVDTLTVHDYFIVMAFTNETKIFDEGWKTIAVANQNGVFPTLISATMDNQKIMKSAIDELEADGITNFTNAFESAFDVIEDSLESEMSSTGPIAILFMSDGRIRETKQEEKMRETEIVINLINERRAQIDRSVVMFTYSLGDHPKWDVGKNISCNTGGIWTPVKSYGEIEGAMSSYYRLFALDHSRKESRDKVVWVEPYEFFTRKVMGTTVSVPVYDRSVTPYLVLGVAAVDVYMEVLVGILGDDATTWLTNWIQEEYEFQNTEIELDECQLDALRLLGGRVEATCGKCNSTSLVGLLPDKCEYTVESLDSIWDNLDLKEEKYPKRACCGSDNTRPGTCTVPIPTPDPKPIGIIVGVGSAVGVVVAVVFAAVAFIYCVQGRKDSSGEDASQAGVNRTPSDIGTDSAQHVTPPNSVVVSDPTGVHRRNNSSGVNDGHNDDDNSNEDNDENDDEAPMEDHESNESNEGQLAFVARGNTETSHGLNEELNHGLGVPADNDLVELPRQTSENSAGNASWAQYAVSVFNRNGEDRLDSEINRIRSDYEKITNERETTRLHELCDELTSLSQANEETRSERFSVISRTLVKLEEELVRRSNKKMAWYLRSDINRIRTDNENVVHESETRRLNHLDDELNRLIRANDSVRFRVVKSELHKIKTQLDEMTEMLRRRRLEPLRRDSTM